MLITILILLGLAVLGGVLFRSVKPEQVVAREVGRAMMWGAILGLVWLVAREVPPVLR